MFPIVSIVFLFPIVLNKSYGFIYYNQFSYITRSRPLPVTLLSVKLICQLLIPLTFLEHNHEIHLEGEIQ